MEDQILDDVLRDIFCLLDGKDLKICRQVSKYWGHVSRPMLTEKTCIILDGQSKKYKNIFLAIINFCSKNKHICQSILTYLNNSDTKFSLWKYMRIRQMTTSQIKILLRNWSMKNLLGLKSNQNLLQTVTKLEVINCRIDCLIFMELLKYFIHVVTFIDDHCKYYTPFIFNGICRNLEKLEYNMEQNYNFKMYRLTKIFIKQTHIEPNLRILLRMLDIICTHLKGFIIELDSEKDLPDKTWRTDFCNLLGSFLSKHTSTLRVFSFSCYNLNPKICFQDFLKILNIFEMNSDDFALEELEIKIFPIDMSIPEFQNNLIPCLKRYRKLKILAINKIECKGWNSLEIMKQIKSDDNTQLEFKFGGMLCDRSGPGFPHTKEHKLVFQSDFFTKCLESLYVVIQTRIPNLQTLLPLCSELKFKNVLALAIDCTKLETDLGPIPIYFHDYNINLMVITFPNLTELYLVDGKDFEYYDSVGSGQYDKMSPATIGNEDLKNIILELCNLVLIYIQARLTITDSGFTGLSSEICERMNLENMYEIENYSKEFIGVGLSKLKRLKYISIYGLSDITNVTLCIAFNQCKNLKTLSLFGKLDQITKFGKIYLEQLAKKNGFTVENNL